MELKNKVKAFTVVLGLCLSAGSEPQAALTNFETFTGNIGYSADGFGSTGNSGTISAEVPSNSTIISAYLYSSTFQTTDTPTVLLSGAEVAFGPQTQNASACCGLGSFRADVTSIVKPVIDGGPGGNYDFNITEAALGGNIDGEALIVVYSNSALPTATYGIMDGYSSVTPDTIMVNFAAPLDPESLDFFAELALGIGYSCCDEQSSTVTVNGSLLTEHAGNMDDADSVNPGNGRLITVGGTGDPYSPEDPSYAEDHEKYDLTPFVSQGDSSINVEILNASGDDNIFFAGFFVPGLAGFNAPPPGPPSVPEPGTFILLSSGLLFVAAARRGFAE